MKIACAVAVGLAALASASAANAIEIVYADANPTLMRPDVGSVSYLFDANIVIDPGYFVNRMSLTGAANSVTHTDNLVSGFDPQLNTWFNIASTTPGTSYSGPIFEINVDASVPLGLYDYTLAGPLPYFLVNENSGVDGVPNNNGINQEVVANFTITVVGAAAPEPATWALSMFGLAAVGVALRSSKRIRRVGDAA
jgi:hypothetical protein